MIDHRTFRSPVFAGALAVAAFLSLPSYRGDASEKALFPGAGGVPDAALVTATDAECTVGDAALSVATGRRERWPGITARAPRGEWDLAAFAAIAADVTNLGDAPLKLFCRVDNPGADGSRNCVAGEVMLPPRSAGTLRVRLTPTPWSLTRPLELVGMRAAPGPRESFDPRRVTQLLFFVSRPGAAHRFEIRRVRAEGSVTVLDADSFFPFIDELGQFIHADWPGKTRSAAELRDRLVAEEKDLDRHPGPTRRNEFGGWTGGPELPATGFFRVEKHRGSWWLVDPEGRLFWSHGVDCVRSSISTPISDRECYFRGLPAPGSPLSRFYGTGNWAPHGYYREHSPYHTYDFGRANLLRKYGEDWEERFAAVTQRRLRSWGLNTIGNWSDPAIYAARRTPYVATIGFRSRPIEGSQGYWGKFPDVFDPGFREGLRRRLESERGASAGDPWCLGYFVHNELSWGDETSLALGTLASPADQPAKQAFVEALRDKYGDIAALDRAWGSTHGSWQALLASRETPDLERGREDLLAFYTTIAETYFRTVREEVKRVAPQQLYLGCRFAWVNDRAARAATRYCDVVSYNRYAYTVEDLRLPDGIDMPVIIGEFHFGALDRGLFHTGLRPTENQEDRAARYASYLHGALRNPLIVGTHWFQYRDQATTGRGDGENYQIGFVDVCDTPYPETVAVLRQMGESLYEVRLGE